MRAWALLLGGLIVWTIHFFTLYAIASVLATTTLARLLTGAVTLACLASDAFLLVQALRRQADPLDRWMKRVAALAAGLSFLAVLWQGLPALLV